MKPNSMRKMQSRMHRVACIGKHQVIGVLLLCSLCQMPRAVSAVTRLHTAAGQQDPAQNSDDEARKRELEMAEFKQKLAEAEKAAAEARKATLEANRAAVAGPSSVTAKTGDITGDTSKFVETRLLAEKAAEKASGKLSAQIRNFSLPNKDAEPGRSAPRSTAESEGKIKTLVVYNATDLLALSSYKAMLVQLYGLLAGTKQAVGEVENSKAEFTTAAIGGGEISLPFYSATGVLKSIAELFSLFKTDTEFKDQPITVSEEMIISYLVMDLNTHSPHITVYYPLLYPPNVLTTEEGTDKPAAQSPFLEALNRLVEQKVQAVALLKEFEDLGKKIAKNEKDVEELKKEIAELEKISSPDAATLEKIKTKKKQVEAINGGMSQRKAKKTRMEKPITRLAFFNLAIEELTKSLNTVDEKTKLTPLALIIRTESLAVLLKDPKTYVLRLTPPTANGTTRIRRNLFFNAKSAHSGGVSVYYQLFDTKGIMVDGGVVMDYIEYTDSKDVHKRLFEPVP
ncbi:MAG: hypothetical protein HY231_12755 [Acidobacteria bacterium]|nr:hypothetical protein [Acidobacteriota bacterium]